MMSDDAPKGGSPMIDREFVSRVQREFDQAFHEALMATLRKEFDVDPSLGYEHITAAVKRRFGLDAQLILVEAEGPSPTFPNVPICHLVVERNGETVWRHEIAVNVHGQHPFFTPPPVTHP